MIEQNASAGMDAGNVSVQPAIESSAADTSTQPTSSTPVVSPVVETKLAERPVKVFNEDQMRIISNNAKKAGERDAEERLKRQYESQLGLKPTLNTQEATNAGELVGRQPQTANSSQNGSNAILDQEAQFREFKRRLDSERAQEYANAQTQQIANDFVLKVQASNKGDKLDASGIGNLPPDHPIIPLLNSIDNVPDVLDDLAAHPSKVPNLIAITYLNPLNGLREIQALSDAIKRNKEALAKAKAPAPPDQLKPSTYGLSGGERSIADKRKDPLYRF